MYVCAAPSSLEPSFPWRSFLSSTFSSACTWGSPDSAFTPLARSTSPELPPPRIVYARHPPLTPFYPDYPQLPTTLPRGLCAAPSRSSIPPTITLTGRALGQNSTTSAPTDKRTAPRDISRYPQHQHLRGTTIATPPPSFEAFAPLTHTKLPPTGIDWSTTFARATPRTPLDAAKDGLGISSHLGSV